MGNLLSKIHWYCPFLLLSLLLTFAIDFQMITQFDIVVAIMEYAPKTFETKRRCFGIALSEIPMVYVVDSVVDEIIIH